MLKKVLFSAKILSNFMDSTFAFDETNYLGNCILRWNRYQHVGMVRHKMPFQYFALSSPCQFLEDFA